MHPGPVTFVLLLLHTLITPTLADPVPIAHWPLIDSAADITPDPLSTPVALRIGLGEHDHLNGRIRDLGLYDRALDTRTIRRLSRFPR